MTTVTIDLDRLYNPRVEQYFLKSDRRIMTGLRSTLNALGIPHPDYALKRAPGPNPGLSALANFYADNPNERPIAAVLPRKANASPEVVAAARAKSNRNP